MTDRRTAINLLRDNGFELARSRKHHVYKNYAGRTVVLPSTPSDVNAWKAALADMKKRYGLVPEAYRPKARVRTPRPVPAEPAPFPIESVAATRPLTPDENALLATWQCEEDRRLRKEANLLHKWEQQEKQAQARFADWVQSRAGMAANYMGDRMEAGKPFDAVHWAFHVAEPLLNRATSLRYDVVAFYRSVVTMADEDRAPCPTFVFEVRQAPGYPSSLIDLVFGVVVTQFNERVRGHEHWCIYDCIETITADDDTAVAEASATGA
jgi:hypothetical protein